MAETVRDRINNYLEDAIAAERNFEHALHTFGTAGVQEPVRALLASAGDKARTQHERLTTVLQYRGGSPSEAKTALAHLLAVSPLTAQAGHEPQEKNTQHLIVTYAAAAAERAMYEALAEAADEAAEAEVLQLAKQLQKEEEDDARQVWPLLRPSALDAFRAAIAAQGQPVVVLGIYLQDAIAAEKSFEDQLVAFSKEGNDEAAQAVFARHAQETRTQYERLTARLHEIGGSTSFVKSLLARFFSLSPKVAQAGHDASERMTQNLMMGYSVENSEIAMYEVLAAVAGAAEDRETEKLVLDIQQQERETAEKVWQFIGPAARRSIRELTLAKAS